MLLFLDVISHCIQVSLWWLYQYEQEKVKRNSNSEINLCVYHGEYRVSGFTFWHSRLEVIDKMQGWGRHNLSARNGRRDIKIAENITSKGFQMIHGYPVWRIRINVYIEDLFFISSTHVNLTEYNSWRFGWMIMSF